MGSEFDIIVYGASGYTGRLIAEHLASRYGPGGGLRWALAGRSAEKLADARAEAGAPSDTPLIVADSADADQVASLASRCRAVITTVGPYQRHGSELVKACADGGVDYLDLCGEPNWMRSMIDAHEASARRSGARVLFSCGFDSIPFELGVYFIQEAAKERYGVYAPHVKARVRGLRGGLSGGTAASGQATMEALKKDPAVLGLLLDPFALTPGFKGPEQPDCHEPALDPDVGPVAPFMMAAINTKNVHRSNLLMGHRYGPGFLYDEMAMGEPGSAVGFDADGTEHAQGQGPSLSARQAGFYDLLFIAKGLPEPLRANVRGALDPGYGSTSKMIVETAICLLDESELDGGMWLPGAALRGRLIERLVQHAGLRFALED